MSMIARSIASFFGSHADLTAAGLLTAEAITNDDSLSEFKAPCCLVRKMHEGAQDLWVIGDAKRHQKPIYLARFFATSEEAARIFAIRARRAIESATATDVESIAHPT